MFHSVIFWKAYIAVIFCVYTYCISPESGTIYKCLSVLAVLPAECYFEVVKKQRAGEGKV